MCFLKGFRNGAWFRLMNRNVGAGIWRAGLSTSVNLSFLSPSCSRRLNVPLPRVNSSLSPPLVQLQVAPLIKYLYLLCIKALWSFPFLPGTKQILKDATAFHLQTRFALKCFVKSELYTSLIFSSII